MTGSVPSSLSVPGVLVGSHREWSAPFGLPGLVRDRALLMPDDVALEAEGATLTFAQLEFASDATAARLRAARGRPGQVVAVCLPRGLSLVVALLGALKAGMAYLPLSTDDPQVWRDLLLRRSGARHVLVDAVTATQATSQSGVQLVLVQDHHADGPATPGQWADLVAYGEDHAAYVLFTSGTTGTPKGVVIPSGALVNRLLWMRDTFDVGPHDRILQKTPYTFDVSGWELWLPLIAGARMVLLPPDAHRDPGQVIQHIVERSVTLCHFVPSMLTEFLRWPTAGQCGSLRTVFCSGEELTPGHVRQFRRLLRAELVNLYGPTEATIDVSYWPCPPDGDVDRTLIGGPISNCTLVVLKDDRSPARPGEVGELAIGGTPLATGYLGEPRLTDRVFVPAPPWAPASRLYLTGDLVRQHGEGLEFLGRRDAQVKIRGQRVELTSVEDALREVDGVVDAAATTVDRGAGAELCALVVLAAEGGDLGRIRPELRRTVTDSLVPTVLLPVPAIPLTRSGKQDRRQVRERAAALLAAGAGGGYLRGDDRLSWLWREALGGDPARPETGFLDAGGHSLTAARLAGLVLREYGVRLPLRRLLLDNMSQNDLRSWLSTATQRDAIAPHRAAARRETPRRDTISSRQRSLWLWSQIFPGCPAYNVTAVLELDRRVDVARLQGAVNALVRRHPLLRTTIHDAGVEVVRRVHPPGVAEVPVAVGGGDDAVTRVLDWVFTASLLPRIKLGVRREPERPGDTLVLALDHLVSDQRSLELLLAELGELYAGHRSIERPGEQHIEVDDDPPSPDRRESDLAFWADRLRDAPPALDLPFRLRSPAVPSFRGASRDQPLGAGASERVGRFCTSARVTPFALVLTVFARRLALWAGVDDLVIGVPMAGRESAAEQDVLGFFVRTVPIRIRGVSARSTSDAVKSTAEALLEAAEHAAVSFEEIVERLGGPRGLARNPVFQAWCNDLSHAEEPSTLGDAVARVVEPPARWSLFDVCLYLCRGQGGTLRLRLVYSSDLWAGDTAAEFLRQCTQDLLQTVGAERSDGPAGPAPAAPQPPRRTCADLVDAVLDRARARPERTAVASAGGVLTFQQLRHRLLQVSTAVHGYATGTPSVVGVLARRHADLAAAILGCWHAGTAPLLLDADAPAAWRHEALRMADAAVFLEVAPGPEAAGAGSPLPRLALTDWWWARAPLEERRTSAADPDRLGHVMLTSGTTGGPAVVALPADALPAVLDGYAERLGLTGEDSFAFTVPPAHDPVFRDLLLALRLGAVVHVPGTGQDPRSLVPWLDEVGATVLHLTPAQGLLLTAAHPDRVIGSLRRVVFHGDKLHAGTVARMRRLAPCAQIYNLYGTTETPQASALRLVEPGEGLRDGELVPIAAAAPHRAVSVLGPDGHDRVGVLGELVVTGTGLMLGHLGGNAEGSRSHARAGGAAQYRTGDLGRRRPDGLIDMAGRSDRGVSVCGHRVQLDGVEAVIRAVDGVADCHVAVPPGEARLVAWWSASAEVDPTAIRSALRSRLVAAAVPEEMHRVPSIPLTTRGKVDTRALLGLRRAPLAPPPSAVSEEPLLELIVRRAGEQQPDLALGPDDDFFATGMASLSLLRLYESLRAELDGAVALADFFRFPTPRRLAEHVASGRVGEPGARPRRRGGSGFADELKLRRMARRIAAGCGEKEG